MTFTFGTSARLRERLAGSDGGVQRNDAWTVADLEKRRALLLPENHDYREIISDGDLETLSEFRVGASSFEGGQFAVIKLEATWHGDGLAVNHPYQAFQHMRSVLESLAFGPGESRGLPEVPAFILLTKTLPTPDFDDVDSAFLYSENPTSGRLKIKSKVEAFENLAERLPQCREAHMIRNFRNEVLLLAPIRFAQGQGYHTWAFCHASDQEKPTLDDLTPSLHRGFSEWEFHSTGPWEFMAILYYWLNLRLVEISSLRHRMLEVVESDAQHPEEAYERLISLRGDIAKEVMATDIQVSWIPGLADRATRFQAASNVTSVRDTAFRLPGRTENEESATMTLPSEVSITISEVAAELAQLERSLSSYVEAASLREQHRLLKQGSRTNRRLLWLTGVLFLLTMLQADQLVEWAVRAMP